jgi:hypothetical protein
MAIHESKASWGDSRDETLLPRLQAGIPGGFESPPQETEVEVYNLQP